MKSKGQAQAQSQSQESSGVPMSEKVMSRVAAGVTSFSVVAPLYFADEYQSSNGVFYHFYCGEVPVTCYGYNGKWAKENLEGQLCRVSGEIRVNQSTREGSKPFVNLNADSIVKVWLP